MEDRKKSEIVWNVKKKIYKRNENQTIILILSARGSSMFYLY